jgi:hypothetical protein
VGYCGDVKISATKKMYTLISGSTRVEIPDEEATGSELLAFLDPEEVHLPDFIERHLEDVVGILHYLSHTHPTSPGEIVRMCSLNRLDEVFSLLDSLQFLDIRIGVEMLFAHINETLMGCATVDDVIRCMYDPAEFEALPLSEQREVYEMLLKNFHSLT